MRWRSAWTQFKRLGHRRATVQIAEEAEDVCAVVAAVVAIIQVAVVFGWNLTTDQFAALAVAVNLIGTAVVVVWSRGKVTPVDDPRLPSDQ